MRTWAKGSAPAALLAVAVMTIGSGTAVADTDGRNSILGGNQVDIPISLPVDISGNAIGIIGDSQAGSRGGASVENRGGGSGDADRTSGRNSILGGNQVNAPIDLPVNACGNAVSLIGSSDAGCKGGATVRDKGGNGSSSNRTNGDNSILGGNQLKVPVDAPVNVCGNSVAVVGEATSGCVGGAKVKNKGKSDAGKNITSGRNSILGGNQVIAPIDAPVNVCGNSVAVVGSAFAGCVGGAKVTSGGKDYRRTKAWRSSGTNVTSGRNSILGGNQIVVPVDAPVNVCGNSVAVVGEATSGCVGGAKVKNKGKSDAGKNITSGRNSILGGNQVIAPIDAPINICGNAVTLLGEAFAGCRGGASVTTGSGWTSKTGKSSVKETKKAKNQKVKVKESEVKKTETTRSEVTRVEKKGNEVKKTETTRSETTRVETKQSEVKKTETSRSRQEQVKKDTSSTKKKDVYVTDVNITSGRNSILGGNQVVVPINAPINICGNAVAVLGDATAGCLGGASVGNAALGYGSAYNAWGTSSISSWSISSITAKRQLASQTAAGEPVSLPLVGDLLGGSGLPILPDTPGLTNTPSTPVQPSVRSTKPAKSAKGKHRKVKKIKNAVPAQAQVRAQAQPQPQAQTSAQEQQRDGGAPLDVVKPVTDLVLNPIGDAAHGVTSPLSLDLKSAEEPTGTTTGMNAGALMALVLGAAFAFSSSMVAATRRLRFHRR